MKRAVIFDCDGTLVDSLGFALESFTYALEKIGERPRGLDEVRKYFGAAADRIFFSLLGDQDKALRAFEYYFEHQSALAPRMVLFPGVRDLLAALVARGVPIGVVTGRHARDLDVILATHSLAPMFGSLVADSHLPRSKPAPDGILLACSQLGVDARDSYYVGDSPSDMAAARNAGARGVAALWDTLASEAALSAEKPWFAARTPGDVLAMWERDGK